MMNLNYHNNVSFIDNNDSYDDNSKNDMILLIINTSISFLRDDNNTTNSSSNTGTNTTNYDNDNTCEICGWMAAFCSMIAFGTFGVPIKSKASKSVDVDPLVFQSYKTAMCFLTSWIVLAMGEEFSFTPWGIVSGIFWVPGYVNILLYLYIYILLLDIPLFCVCCLYFVFCENFQSFCLGSVFSSSQLCSISFDSWCPGFPRRLDLNVFIFSTATTTTKYLRIILYLL